MVLKGFLVIFVSNPGSAPTHSFWLNVIFFYYIIFTFIQVWPLGTFYNTAVVHGQAPHPPPVHPHFTLSVWGFIHAHTPSVFSSLLILFCCFFSL